MIKVKVNRSELNDAVGKYIERLKLHNDFLCDRNEPDANPFSCKDCGYYYRNEYGSSKCLKKDIKDWCFYRIEQED